MSTSKVWRTQATDTVTVSTVLQHEGDQRFYETAIIVGGRVSDGVRTPSARGSKFQAGLVHDGAVAWARGYRDRHNVRHDFWTRQLADIA